MVLRAERVTLVHNASSGWGDLSDRAVVKALERAGHEVRAVDAKQVEPGDLEKGCDVVVAAGGDGTVLGVARRIAHGEIPMAVLPVGTANNLARSIGIAGGLAPLLETLAHPEERALDLGVAVGSWGERVFAESAGIGWFCDALIDGLDKNDKPIDRALARLSTLLEKYEPRAWTITIDGEDASGAYAFVDVMNARMVGPNLCFAPSADSFDGTFDVVLAKRDDQARIQRYVDALRIDRATPPPEFEVRRATRVHVALGARDRIRVDGGLCPKKGLTTASTAELRVLPGAVRLWLPRKKAAA